MNTPGEIVDFNLAEGWKLAPLEDLFDILRNATSSRAEYSADGQVACVHYGDIHVKWNCFLILPQNRFPVSARPKHGASPVERRRPRGGGHFRGRCSAWQMR